MADRPSTPEDTPIVRVVVERRTRSVVRWLLPAAVGAAAALAASFIVLTLGSRPDVHLAPETHPVPSTIAGVAVLPAPIVLEDAVRGATAAAATRPVPDDRHTLAFRLPELFLPDSVVLAVALVSSSGDTLATGSARVGDLASERPLVVTAAGPLDAGTYMLAVRPRAPGEPEHRFEFRLTAGS